MFVTSRGAPDQSPSPAGHTAVVVPDTAVREKSRTPKSIDAEPTAVIVKSRDLNDRGMKYRGDDISLLECDFFDAALRHPEMHRRDGKGRIELELRADQGIVRQALRCVEAQHYEAPPGWDESAKILLNNILDYLGPRPLVRAREAQVAAEAAAARAIPQGYSLLLAGSFMMGSPADEAGRFDNEVQHLVRLTQPFLLKSTPVTQAEYFDVIGTHPSHFPVGDVGRAEFANHPVVSVTLYQAMAYCNVRSSREGLTASYDLSGWAGQGDYTGPQSPSRRMDATGYYIPTEAQWEYGARSGSTAATYAAPGQVLTDLAWFSENSGGRTHPVGQKAANGAGLFDMLGNVYEWTSDRHAPFQPVEQENPCGADAGMYRVCRGGSWTSAPRYVRAANRSGHAPSVRYSNLGFRPARSYDCPTGPLDP